MPHLCRRYAPLLLLLLGTGCWYHRVDVPEPITYSGVDETFTVWPTFWHSRTIDPGPTCPTGTIKEVRVRSNWGYSLIRAATLGLVAPAVVDRYCARPLIVEPGTPPNSTPGADPGAGNYWSFIWGRLQREESPECNGRGMATVQLRANPFFDILSAGTAGLVSPMRIGWTCVQPTSSPSSPGAPR